MRDHMPLGAMLPEPMGYVPSLPARSFHRRGFLKADEIQSRHGRSDRGDLVSFRGHTDGSETERGSQHQRPQPHEMSEMAPTPASKDSSRHQARSEAPAPHSSRGSYSPRTLHSARERSAMPGYGGHVPFRPWTIGRRHMGYTDSASRGSGLGDFRRYLRGGSSGGFAGRPSPERRSNRFDDTEQSEVTGRVMRKGGYADHPSSTDSGRYATQSAAATAVTERSSAADGASSERSYSERGADTDRSSAASRAHTRPASADAAATRAAGRGSQILPDEHPDRFMGSHGRGEEMESSALSQGGMPRGYQGYAQSEQPRGKCNARAAYEAQKQPQQRYRQNNFRINNSWSPRGTPRATDGTSRGNEQSLITRQPYGKPSGPYAAPYTHEAHGPVYGSRYGDGISITEHRRSSREAYTNESGSEEATRVNRFSGSGGGARTSHYRTSPNGAPLGKSRSAAAGYGVPTTTFTGVSTAIVRTDQAGVPSRRESWLQSPQDHGRDSGLYA